jgi:hypothetical protein
MTNADRVPQSADGWWDDLQDQVWEAGPGVWRCMVNGQQFGDWPDRGSAYAGMQTEQRRAAQ